MLNSSVPTNSSTSTSASTSGCVDVSTKLITDGNIVLDFCVYNGSGPRCGTIEALQKINTSQSGAVLTKSATITNQTGNPLPRIYHTSNPHYCSFNSEGLPNNGIDYYISNDTIQQVYTTKDEQQPKQQKQSKRKPYIVSLSGKTLDDNLEMLRRIATRENTAEPIDSIELNLACPNVIGKPIIGYDVQQMELILKSVSSLYEQYNTTLPPLGIKLPPYFDFNHYNQVATVINQYKSIVRYVVTINTVGNTLCIDPVSNMPLISSNNGYAGLSGPAIKYIALANVHKLRELLNPSISIIGVGGISTGRDVYEMLLCGASACQVATCHWLEGSQCFNRIRIELVTIMIEKSIYTIADITNQLQPWSKDGSTLSRQYTKTNPTSPLVISPLLLIQQSQASSSTNTTTITATSSTTKTKTELSAIEEASFYKLVSIGLGILVLALLVANNVSITSSLLPTE